MIKSELGTLEIHGDGEDVLKEMMLLLRGFSEMIEHRGIDKNIIPVFIHRLVDESLSMDGSGIGVDMSRKKEAADER